MIRSARCIHRFLVPAIGAATLLGVGLGLKSRQAVPAMHPTDPALHGLRPGSRPAGADDTSRVAVDGLDLSLARVRSEGRTYLDLYPGPGLLEPDVLIYHSANAAAANGTLPSDVLLLGTLAGLEPRRVQLPSERVSGHLILYSLAHTRLLGSAPIPE